jgi:hypothetical protein
MTSRFCADPATSCSSWRGFWRTLSLAGLLVLAGADVFGGADLARGENDPSHCHPAAVESGGMLLQCGPVLRSFVLSLEDIRREVGNEADGRFVFHCPFAMMCRGDPSIDGWFIDQQAWLEGRRDAAALAAVLADATQPQDGGAKPPVERPSATCEAFDVTLAGLPGKAGCFRLSATQQAVAVVAADQDIGLMLLFSAAGGDAQGLRDWVSAKLPHFSLARAEGDARLLRWIR